MKTDKNGYLFNIGTKYDCNIKKGSDNHNYKDHCIFRADVNSSGIKYFTYSLAGSLRADTLSGIKKLINQVIKDNK